MQVKARPKKNGRRVGRSMSGSRRSDSAQTVTAMKWEAASRTECRVRFSRSIGRTERHMGSSRTDDRLTASAMAGGAVLAMTAPKNSNCPGPAQTRTVESTAAPTGKPAARASEPTPIRDNGDIKGRPGQGHADALEEPAP